jgi:Ca-activated chloride channel family protein
MSALAQFHFLRPEWLWLLLPAGLIAWRLARRRAMRRGWSHILAPHLLDTLLSDQRQQAGRIRPQVVLPVAWLIGIIALAAPAWQREPSPLAEDTAAVVIVLRVGPEMLASDIQPSRLQRAIHKVHDLLQLRPGTRNALVAYGGSAHLVVPLTRDGQVIEDFAAGLDPGIMPVAGDAVVEAIALANDLLERDGATGSVVLMTDAIDPAADDGLRAIDGADVHILAVAAGPEVLPPLDSPPAPPLDLAALQRSAQALDASVTTVSVDDADVRRLTDRIRNSFARAPPGEGERWRDEGWWLLLPLALLVLLQFRNGGAVAPE